MVHRAGLSRRSPAATASLRGLGLGARAIRALDRLLRRCHGVFEFTDDPECLLRLAVRPARSDIRLRDGTRVRSGDAIVELHLWNEQLPPVSRGGPDLAWGALVDRQMRRSLSLLAAHLAAAPTVVAVHGEAALGCQMGGPQRVRLAGRYGFEIIEGKPRWPSRLRRFCDDLLFWSLTRIFNPHGLRGKRLHRARYDIWMSRAELDRRWATAAPADRGSA